MGQIQFERGKFRTYRVTNQIHLGKYAITLPQDARFEYDGTKVRHGGVEFDVPQLQGLYGTWYVPATDTTTQYKSRPAGVQVRAATPEGEKRGDAFTMGQAEEDNAVVGTMDHAREIRTAAADPKQAARLAELRAQRQTLARPAQRDTYMDSNPAAPPPQNAADVDPEAEAALMADVETRYIAARPVHVDGTAGAEIVSDVERMQVARANQVNQANLARKVAELNEADPYKTREEMGGQRHDALEQRGRRVGGGKFALVKDEQDDGEVVGTYKFSAGATVGSEESARLEAQTRPTNVTRVPSTLPVQVGQAVATTPNRRVASSGAQVIDDPMTTHEPQAVRARSTTQIPRQGNVGIDEVFPGGGTGDVDQPLAAEDLSELLPDAEIAGLPPARSRPEAAAPRKVVLPPPPSEEEEIQEIVTNWSTHRNWQKRVEEAVEFYSDWPEALNAIMAIESEAVVKQIQARIAAKIAKG